jgi:hypothetical protein
MVDRIVNQTQHVVVGERIKDVLSLAPALDKARCMERPQAGRDGCDLLVFLFGDLRDARLAAGKPQQQPKPFGISDRAKQRRGDFGLFPGR